MKSTNQLLRELKLTFDIIVQESMLHAIWVGAYKLGTDTRVPVKLNTGITSVSLLCRTEYAGSVQVLLLLFTHPFHTSWNSLNFLWSQNVRLRCCVPNAHLGTMALDFIDQPPFFRRWFHLSS